MAKLGISRDGRHAVNLTAFVLFFIAGLALSRLLYEAAFPRLLPLARPIPAVLFALLIGGMGWLTWIWANRRLASLAAAADRVSFSVWALIPLLINLGYLINPAVDLIYSRLLFAASIWLTALFSLEPFLQQRGKFWPGALFVLGALFPVYLATVPATVGRADTFEFQVVIPQLGIAHPTGYPLYILLGRLFAFIPVGSMAWRVNLASVVFTLLALIFLYLTVKRLSKGIVPSVLSAVVLGLTPVYWSQAIEAEVYALHALFVAFIIWLMITSLSRTANSTECASDIITKPLRVDWSGAIILLAFVSGLGLTNHLTTLFLVPPVLLTIILAFGLCLRRQPARANIWLLLQSAGAFLLPLLLYAYLPLRWSALHEEAMGLDRFIQWVIGGRFQGALQLSAWRTDLTRYQVVGRLLLQNWGWINILLIVLGLANLIRLHWRAALVLLMTWLGFIFYALNYYVPDLAVFIIPAHVVMAVFWGAGLAAAAALVQWLANKAGWVSFKPPLANILILLLLLPTLSQLGKSWSEMAGKNDNQLLNWGQGVLAMPLDDGAALLADSEKIAPLYYLQQAEGIRPDLDIMVLPDETAYRAELDARVQAGQTVYLARYLPGLAGVYHLRSAGPLVEVSQEPLLAMPSAINGTNLTVGPLRLVGMQLRESSPLDQTAADVTLYWQIDAPPAEPAFIYLRWAGDGFATDPFLSNGQHPAGNSYPAAAWQVGEIVPDFYLLPRPITDQEQELELQVAVGPAFQPAEQLAWTTVTSVIAPPTHSVETGVALRAQNGRVLLSGVQFPAEIRPETPLPVILTGYGSQAGELQLKLQPISGESGRPADMGPPEAANATNNEFALAVQVGTDLPNGRYYLLSQDPQAGSVCGWLAPLSTACVLGEVAVTGVALPNGAVNYDNKIGLLEVDLPQRQLQPGGQLAVNLRWQGLSPMAEDYTVFIQLLDAQDRIVAQVDAWPAQGTYPTSQWDPGETVEDPYLLQLSNDMPPGTYKLHIGWYLLSTLQRLPVINEDGLPVDDKMVVTDLVVP